MKKGIAHWLTRLLVAGLLLLTSQAHAYYTNYLDAVSNTLAFFYTSLTNQPSTTPSERQQIARIGRALRTLSKPSTNVAGDYKLFVKAATQLGPLAGDPSFLELGSNVFDAFTNEAQVEIFAAGERVAALNDFVRVKRAASNQVRQAQATLDRIPTLSDIRVALLVGQAMFNKITAANRLAAIGERKPGFALNAVAGTSLTHSNAESSGTVTFVDGTNFTESEVGGDPNSGTYTYTRTGLNSATLVLTSEGGGGEEEVTVKLVFTGEGRGKFNARNGAERSKGAFTIP
jgi:hypothetical protein